MAVVAESLGRVIVDIRITSVHWWSYVTGNAEIGSRGPCVCCAAIQVARYVFICVTFVARDTAEWLARVGCVC